MHLIPLFDGKINENFPRIFHELTNILRWAKFTASISRKVSIFCTCRSVIRLLRFKKRFLQNFKLLATRIKREDEIFYKKSLIL